MTEKNYFLPEALEEALSHESAQGITATKGVVEVDGFKIPGFALAGTPETLERFIEKSPIHGSMLAVVTQSLARLKGEEPKGELAERAIGIGNHKVYTLLSVEPSLVHTLFESGSRLMIEMPNFCEKASEILEEFSCRTGLRVRISSPVTRTMVPLDFEERAIGIVIDGSPPGDASSVTNSELCGLQLADDGELIQHRGPALGYGVVVYDDDKRAVAQIVENTLYLFMPLNKKCRRIAPVLFRHILRFAWNAFAENLTPPADTEIASAEAYSDLVRAHMQFEVDAWKFMHRETEKMLQHAEAEYRQALYTKRQATLRMHGMEAIHAGYTPEKGIEQWKRLIALPQVRRVSTIDNKGLHVETHPIIATYKDKRYQLGAYVIRLTPAGLVAIWPVRILRKDGSRAHPHISEAGHPCFGNIGPAVMRAAEELRFADAIQLLLHWLTDGYDPELADTSIEYWPEAEAEQ